MPMEEGPACLTVSRPLAPLKSTLAIEVSHILESLKSAALRSASLRSAPISVALRKSAPLSFAKVKFAPLRLAPPRFAMRRSAPVSFAMRPFAPPRSAPFRSALIKSAPTKHNALNKVTYNDPEGRLSGHESFGHPPPGGHSGAATGVGRGFSRSLAGHQDCRLGAAFGRVSSDLPGSPV